MRVDTSVAIELAVSCRPLRKSNASATMIKPTRRAKCASTFMAGETSQLIDDDRIDLVGDVFEAVDDLFEMIVQLRADDEFHRIALLTVRPRSEKQRLDALVADVVGLLLDHDDLCRDGAEAGGVAADRAQERHGFEHQLGRLQD